jgi:hypothetical protein
MNFDLNAFVQKCLEVAPWAIIPAGVVVLIYVLVVAPEMKARHERRMALMERQAAAYKAEQEALAATRRDEREAQERLREAEHKRRMEELSAQKSVASGLATTSENSTESMRIAERMQEGSRSMMTVGDGMIQRLMESLERLSEHEHPPKRRTS